MQLLFKEIRQFVEGRHPRALWERLTTSPGLLLRELQAAIVHDLSPDGLAALDECCRQAESDAFRRQIPACYPLNDGDPIDADRLHRNVIGLLRTAQVAIAAHHLPMAGPLPELLMRSVVAAARCLSAGQQPEIQPSWPDHHLGGLNEFDVIEQVFGLLAQAGWEVCAARLWTLYWLTDGFTQKQDVLPRERLEVPFTAWVENQQSARLVWLHLYRLGESGPLIEHPGNALRPLGSNWLKAMEAAWERSARPAVCWNVCLHSPEKRPPLLFRGDSAGGAAGVAFEVLRQALAYDTRCLVVATIHSDGALEGVTQEKEKILAAMSEAGFRRAVVARGGKGVPGTQLRPQDIDTFARNGLHVDRVHTLAEAVRSSSLLATQLRAYLVSLLELPDRDIPPYLAGRHLTGNGGMYQPPDVWARMTREDHPGVPRRRVSVRSEQEETGRLAYYDEKRRRVSLERERRRLRRAVILGGPGEGKTTLARMNVHNLAQGALDHLVQGKGLYEIDIPIYLRLDDVARLRSVVDAVRESLKEGLVDVADFVIGRISSELGWLFLDGLDEVDDIHSLREALQEIPDACRVVVTSRRLGYSRSALPFRAVSEYELAPLTPRQRQQFINRWFDHDPARRSRVDQLARANPQLNDLTRNALLLTLTCAAAEHHDLLPESTRRVDLYRLILRDMVRGVWRPNPRRDDDPHVDELLLHLERVSWELFQNQPARNRFTYHEWKTAISSDRTLRDSTPTSPATFIEELQQCGLLVHVGKGERQLVHRTFLEFFAAEYVARQENPIGLIDHFLWQRDNGNICWQPKAAEMICFLAGCLRNADGLFQRLLGLDEERPDRFHTMVRLAGRCLAEVDENRVDACLCSAIADRVIALWRRPPGLRRQHIHLALAHRRGLSGLLEALRDPEPEVRRNAARALGELGDPSALPALLQGLRDSVESVRQDAAQAAAELGELSALPALFVALRDLDQGVRRAAVIAMWTLSDASALPPLLGALQDPDLGVRRAAVMALGKLGDQSAVPALLEVLRDPRDPTGSVRQDAAQALGELGELSAVPALLEMLRDPDLTVRMAVVGALGDLGESSALLAALRDPQWFVKVAAADALGDLYALSALLGGLHDQDRDVRSAAAQALGILGDPSASPVLLEALQDPDEFVRFIAAQALGKLGDPSALPALLKALHDPVDFVRSDAAKALGELGALSAIPALREALGDSDKGVREAAAQALGELGDPSVLPTLLEALHDPTGSVRWAPAEAMDRIHLSSGRWIPAPDRS